MDFSHITLKRHPRARSVKLKASVRHGIQVVVPLRFNEKQLPRILEMNKSWIEKHWQVITTKQQAEVLPETLMLPSLNESWKIFYISTEHKKVTLTTRLNEEIVLLGNIKNKTICKKILIDWLKERAASFLSTMLKAISEEMQLPYQALTIRGQQTRWGSCTRDKNISLNFKLIFLPIHLVRHILIHELAHTVHLNHGKAFWRLVAAFDLDWKKHHIALRKTNHFIPAIFSY